MRFFPLQKKNIVFDNMQQMKKNIYAQSVTFPLFGFNISNFGKKYDFSFNFSLLNINRLFAKLHRNKDSKTYFIVIRYLNWHVLNRIIIALFHS